MGRGGGEAENGVAPVIATLLILALTIFMVAIFATVILNIGNTDAAPIAGVIISENNGVISLTHYSGAALHVGEYKILVNGVDQTNKFQPAGRDFSPGTKLTWDLGITQPLSDVSVVYTGEGKSVVIAEKKFNREGTAKANAKFSASVPAGKGKDATSQVKTGVSGAQALPAIVADQADVWVVLDSVSGQVTVEFTAEESSDMTYSWTFSNGQTNSTRMASFVYNTAGSYTVRLDIVDNISGDVGTSSMIVAVRNPGVTVMLWVKSEEIYPAGSSDIWMIAERGYGGDVDRIWKMQFSYPNSHGLQMVFYFEKTGSAPNTQIRFKTPPSLEKKWYHMTGVYDQRGISRLDRSKLYIYGVDSGNTPTEDHGSLPLNIPTQPKYDVTHWDMPGGKFATEIPHEVNFPLTAEEIAAIYTFEKGGYT